MFQEEGVHSCQNTAWSALILIDAIFQFFVEEESLFPGVMQMPFSIFE
jgi:hypothetical protein